MQYDHILIFNQIRGQSPVYIDTKMVRDTPLSQNPFTHQDWDPYLK